MTTESLLGGLAILAVVIFFMFILPNLEKKHEKLSTGISVGNAILVIVALIIVLAMCVGGGK